MATGSGMLKQNLRFQSTPMTALFIPDYYHAGAEYRRIHPVFT